MNTDHRTQSPIKEPPHLNGPPLVGHLRAFHHNAPELYSEAFRNYPDEEVVEMRIGHYKRVYLARHPDHAHQILASNADNYPKAGYSPLKPLIGNGLLRNEDPSWRRQKRLMQPALGGESLKDLVSPMAEVVEGFLSRWRRLLEEKGEVALDIEEEMTRLTLGIVSRTLFGRDLSSQGTEVGRSLRFVLYHGVGRIGRLLAPPPGLPTPANVRYRHALDNLEEVVYSLIAEKESTTSPQTDLLSKLMAARDEQSGEGMSKEQLRDEVMTLLTAGHETTAKALCWTFYLLDQNPQSQSEVREEALRVLGRGEPTTESLSYRSSNEEGALNYTRMVLQESMRLFPPVPGLARKVTEDDNLGEYHLRGGSRLILSQYAAHRHPRLWNSPGKFDPYRFTDEEVAKRPRYAYFPFGGGERTCIGNAFAIVEAQIALSMITREFHLSLAPQQIVDKEAAFTLRPRYGLDMTIQKMEFTSDL